MSSVTRLSITVLTLLLGLAPLSCKKKNEEAPLRSRLLECSETTVGPGAWSTVPLPQEIIGKSGAGTPHYFFSDGERLGMHNGNNWAEMRPGSWDWHVSPTSRDEGFELDGSWGPMSRDFLILQTGIDANTRMFTQRLDVLSFEAMRWETIGVPEFSQYSYGALAWTGNEFLLWARTQLEYDGPYQRYKGTTFDGFLFDPVSRLLTPVEAPRLPYEASAEQALRLGSGLWTAWLNKRLYAWGVDPVDGSKWGYFYSVEFGTWTPFNMTGFPFHGTKWSVVSDDIDSIYLIGGHDPREPSGDWVLLRELWRYSISSDSWSQIVVPSYVDPFTGVWMNDKLYVFGECDSDAVYDPKANEWALLPPIPLPAVGTPYAAGGRIMIGQVDSHPVGYLPHVFVYDPAGGRAPADAGQVLGPGGAPGN